MILLPVGEHVWARCEASHHPVNVFFGYGLKDNSAKLVFQKFDSGSCRNPMFAPKLGWNDELALGCKCATKLIHVLHYITCKTLAQTGAIPIPNGSF